MGIGFSRASVLSLLTLAAPAWADTPENCGLTPAAVPDFALVDMNTHSPTYGETVQRKDHLDDVMVIYFAYAP